MCTGRFLPKKLLSVVIKAPRIHLYCVNRRKCQTLPKMWSVPPQEFHLEMWRGCFRRIESSSGHLQFAAFSSVAGCDTLITLNPAALARHRPPRPIRSDPSHFNAFTLYG